MVTEGAADTWAFGLPEESLFHVGLRVLRKKGKEKIKGNAALGRVYTGILAQAQKLAARLIVQYSPCGQVPNEQYAVSIEPQL
jgi:hypothetical protein